MAVMTQRLCLRISAWHVARHGRHLRVINPTSLIEIRGAISEPPQGKTIREELRKEDQAT
jgi:hypothetical protein